MQTGGSSVTRRFRSLRKSNILIESFLPLRVLQQDTELYTAMAYTKWMLHIADFSGQWSDLLATWIGHCHGMKFFRFGMNAFGCLLGRQAASKTWSELCLRHHWNVAQYFATLPGHCWIKRILAWQPAGHKRVGRPKYCWDSMLTNFCRMKGLASWQVTAMDADVWNSLLPEFLAFSLPNVMR